ncbi:unnamed protein product [Mytilus edulis]|uniref:IPT/TIG domain-containing protein n=1 Tax=Mytilus edulis TaxID=6550 RepID=A0A8S3R8I3_MYTED|nr:unnamed protein product [Mytilus edulis]
MIVSNETIYVGGVGGIVSYHRENMTEKAFANINSSVWLLLYDEENEEIIQCNQNNISVSHCSKLDIDLQMTGTGSSHMSVDIRYLPTYSMIYVNEVNTSILVIGANFAKVLSTLYGILSFNLADFKLFDTEPNGRGPMNLQRADEENSTLAFKSSFIMHHMFTSSFKKSKLLCGNIAVEGEYFEYTPLENIHEYCFDTEGNETYCNKGEATEVCKELEGNFCNTQFHNTLVGGNGIENKNPLYVLYKTITTLVHLQLGKQDNLTTKFLSVANSTIIDIKVEQDSIYFITEKKIGKLDINNCSIHKYCESCMNSFNSSCGWDYVVNRCNFNNTNSVVWIPSEDGNCIHFSNIPQHVKINTTDNTIILFQTFPPKSVDVDENVTRRIDGREGVGDENVTCRIDGREGNVSINTDGNSSCQINITNLTTGWYTLEIMYEAVIIGNAKIEFYKCQDLKTCKKCRKRYYVCESWDPINFVCDKPESNLTIQEEENCPQVDSNFALQLHANRFENITIYLIEVESYIIENLNSPNFTCEIGQHDSIVQTIQNVEVQWGINSTNITCLGVKLNESDISYGIRLKYNDMYFDNEVTLIDFPISGPANGGTLITVSSNYEGNSTDEIFLSIDGAECTGVTVRDQANLFRCITGKEVPQNNSKINMLVGNCSSTIVNNIYFTYKDPGVIMNFSPRKGILAGNTIITITGPTSTFEGPDRYNISFCDKDTCIACSILNNLNLHDSKIMCKTGVSKKPRNLTKLVVVIDTFTKLQLNVTFEYLPDPTFDISKNETLKAIESGGVEFEINGDGFNNVGQITVERVEELCKVPSDKKLFAKHLKNYLIRQMSKPLL